MSEWVRAVKAAAVSDGVPVSVEIGEQRICLVKRGGEFFALDDRCSHAESLLSPGDVEDMEIMCPLHGARFDLRTGEALTPPAVLPVQTHEVKVEGGDVLVRLAPSPFGPRR